MGNAGGAEPLPYRGTGGTDALLRGTSSVAAKGDDTFPIGEGYFVCNGACQPGSKGRKSKWAGGVGPSKAVTLLNDWQSLRRAKRSGTPSVCPSGSHLP